MSNLEIVSSQYGQSIWLDHLSRGWMETGQLEEWILKGCRGITTNPSIFEQALTKDDAYNDDIMRLTEAGWTAEAAYWEMLIQDVAVAARLLAPIHQASAGTDGYISIEISPLLAHDTNATITEALALRNRFEARNILIKVPATKAGVAAMAPLMEQGVNLNMTLIFSLERYQEVAETYIDTLVRLDDQQVADAFGVASFFISRIDTHVDDLLHRGQYTGNPPPPGQAAIAQAKLAYRIYLDLYTDNPTWHALLERGARAQRPLWASTSTKNRSYTDTLYVDGLIGSNTINTLPEATAEAFQEHGSPSNSILNYPEIATGVWQSLKDCGINMTEVADQLEAEGVQAFKDAYEEALFAVGNKVDLLKMLR